MNIEIVLFFYFIFFEYIYGVYFVKVPGFRVLLKGKNGAMCVCVGVVCAQYI